MLVPSLFYSIAPFSFFSLAPAVSFSFADSNAFVCKFRLVVLPVCGIAVVNLLPTKIELRMYSDFTFRYRIVVALLRILISFHGTEHRTVNAYLLGVP